MRTKAKSAFEAAQLLIRKDSRGGANYNSAANRAYYALYQALVWRWEEDGYRAEEQDRSAKNKLDAGLEPSWSHSFITKNLGRMRLSLNQEQIVRQALACESRQIILRTMFMMKLKTSSMRYRLFLSNFY